MFSLSTTARVTIQLVGIIATTFVIAYVVYGKSPWLRQHHAEDILPLITGIVGAVLGVISNFKSSAIKPNLRNKMVGIRTTDGVFVDPKSEASVEEFLNKIDRHSK